MCSLHTMLLPESWPATTRLAGLRSSRTLFELVEKDNDSLERRFLAIFYLKGHFHFGFGSSPQVGNGLQSCYDPYFAVHHNGLPESQVVDAVVNQHGDVVYLDDLVPQVRK